MKKIKLFQKKVIIPFIIILVIVVATVLGIYFYKKNNVKEVPVFSMNDIGMTDFWQDSNQTEGLVKEDKTQSVYLSSTQEVEKILVKEGEQVKKGTPLIKYSTTLTSLELERKQIDIKKMELQLDNAKKELEKIRNYQPNAPVQEPIQPEIPEESVENYITFSAPLPEVPKNKEMVPVPLTGSGTAELPYIFLWSEGKEYEKSFIEQLLLRAGAGKTEVYAIFMVRDNNEIYGNFKSASKIKFTKKADEYSFSIVKNYTEDDDPIVEHKSENNVIEVPTIPNNFEEMEASYTAEELRKMTLEKEKEISELILNIKVAKSEYKILESEIKDVTVYSKVDGVVKSVLSLTDSEIKTKPVIVISGGGGYYITGYIGELSLDQIKVGQKVSVMSYNSGSMAEGVVKEVSNIPLSNYRNFGMGNSNVSYYPYTVFVSEEATFKADEYVALTPQVENTGSSGLYVMKAFVLEENGKYFVYVANQDNKLEKRQIFIDGGAYDNLKIKSGLTTDDRIAFPYGKEVKEGANTVEGSMDDLYY